MTFVKVLSAVIKRLGEENISWLCENTRIFVVVTCPFSVLEEIGRNDRASLSKFDDYFARGHASLHVHRSVSQHDNYVSRLSLSGHLRQVRLSERPSSSPEYLFFFIPSLSRCYSYYREKNFTGYFTKQLDSFAGKTRLDLTSRFIARVFSFWNMSFARYFHERQRNRSTPVDVKCSVGTS